LSCLTDSSSVFSFISILCLSSEILSSTYLAFHCVFCLTKGNFYFQDFCLILFTEDFYILFNSSFISCVVYVISYISFL
jgi:hypothetical protein